MKETYQIPMAVKPEIDKVIARIQKKAAIYGKLFSIEEGDAHFEKRRCFADNFGVAYEIGTEFVEVYDLTIESEIVKRDGFEIVARIEHLEGGNIVQMFSEDGDPSWSHILPCCEHCRSKRKRNVTFMVKGPDGFKQIGRSCLKDYSGIDPQRIGILNELRDLILKDSIDRFDFDSHRDAIAYECKQVLAISLMMVDQFGYTKSSENGSNKSRVMKVLAENEQPSNEYLQKADEIISTIEAMDDTDASQEDMMNVKVILSREYCKNSHIGYLAYLPVVYRRYTEKIEKKKEMFDKMAGSSWVGEVGKRIAVEVMETKLVRCIEGYYGTTWMYKMIDAHGNVYLWYASRPFRRTIDGMLISFESGTIKATVKEHCEYQGIKETVLTRCTVA